MSIQDQAKLADFDLTDIHPTDDAIIGDWHYRLQPYEKDEFQKFAPEELRSRDTFLLQEMGKDVPRMTNNKLVAEHLALCIGHMNTKEGEVAFCEMVLAAHQDGVIATRITPLMKNRQQAKTDSILAIAFNDAPLQPRVVERSQNDSDFAALEPKAFK